MDNKTFIENLSHRLDLDKEQTVGLIEQFGEILATASDEGDAVAMPGFGTFEPRKRLEREGLHPSSGKRLLFPPKITLVFKPSAIMKQKFKKA